jgi:hypothetical protein
VAPFNPSNTIYLFMMVTDVVPDCYPRTLLSMSCDGWAARMSSLAAWRAGTMAAATPARARVLAVLAFLRA